MKIISKKVKTGFTVDIEVNNSHCYKLENGLISHNTLSLLSGSTPGVHSAYSEYYYRTVRMASSDPMVEYCKKRGYKFEFEENYDGTVNRDTVVVYFPIHIEDTIYAKDMTAIKQLELVKQIQTEWSDNSVSVTVYYKKEELEEIKQWLKDNYKDSLKTVSFLLHQDHGFKQAVYQDITKEEYERAIKRLKVYEPIKVDAFERDIQDCDSGSCGVNDILVQ